MRSILLPQVALPDIMSVKAYAVRDAVKLGTIGLLVRAGR
jgi:hypothetical protein